MLLRSLDSLEWLFAMVVVFAGFSLGIRGYFTLRLPAVILNAVVAAVLAGCGFKLFVAPPIIVMAVCVLFPLAGWLGARLGSAFDCSRA